MQSVSVQYKSWMQQGNMKWRFERGSNIMLGSKGSHCHKKMNEGIYNSSQGVRRNRLISCAIDRYRAEMVVYIYIHMYIYTCIHICIHKYIYMCIGFSGVLPWIWKIVHVYIQSMFFAE